MYNYNKTSNYIQTVRCSEWNRKRFKGWESVEGSGGEAAKQRGDDGLREEVQIFFTKESKELLDQFCDPEYKVVCSPYLVDFFAQINKLNLQLQGSGNLKLQGMSNEDKIRAFVAKIELWINKVEVKNLSAFETLNHIIDGPGADIKEER
ncbi:unnamed protein product [Callosobruchus maculatus]|uniref:Uncharacterized protein n=1 Tax=Callosobruchus maculatus TaxID=64391 RepID=A0A653CTC9_CALMS|nr:unnamed protein product [Callosobruchus maculatus]